jgi:hypothetical protein
MLQLLDCRQDASVEPCKDVHACLPKDARRD